jgi:hypothetical protein
MEVHARRLTMTTRYMHVRCCTERGRRPTREDRACHPRRRVELAVRRCRRAYKPRRGIPEPIFGIIRLAAVF